MVGEVHHCLACSFGKQRLQFDTCFVSYFLQVPAGEKITTSKISNSDTETKEPTEPECSTTHVLAHSERNFQVHDIIAVAYEDDFYVSEVMNVVSKDELEISSMARYGTCF